MAHELRMACLRQWSASWSRYGFGGLMENATTIALSRLVAQQRAMDVTATNLANANTPGFRAERTMFSDWLLKQNSAETDAYAQDRATYRDRTNGPLTHTANPLDIALAGDGYFTVQTQAGQRLTRAGHFELNSTGRIVDEQGNALLGASGQPIQAASTDSHIVIAGDGSISAESGQLGAIAVVLPDDPSKLRAEGGRLLATDGTTKSIASPRVVQGAIEESNVQPTMELTHMMNDVREFQFVTQFVQAEADRQQGAIDKILQKRV